MASGLTRRRFHNRGMRGGLFRLGLVLFLAGGLAGSLTEAGWSRPASAGTNQGSVSWSTRVYEWLASVTERLSLGGENGVRLLQAGLPGRASSGLWRMAEESARGLWPAGMLAFDPRDSTGLLAAGLPGTGPAGRAGGSGPGATHAMSSRPAPSPAPRPPRTETQIRGERGLPLQRPPEASPRVVVLHSHNSEMYRTQGFAPAEPHEFHRFGTQATGVTRVGARLVQTLEEVYGIPALHVTDLHNSPCHTCAYSESRKTVEAVLERHPNVEAILDIHRDGAPGVSMVTTVGRERAAQVAIVLGWPGSYSERLHPRWQENRAFALRLSGILEANHPGLLRRVIELSDKRYNQDLHPHFLLLEIGNYLDEEIHALRTAELLAGALAELLDGVSDPVLPDVGGSLPPEAGELAH